MSEPIRVVVQAVSNLSTISEQLEEIIRLTKLSQQQAAAASDANLRGHLLQATAIKNVNSAIDEQTTSLKKAGSETTKNTQQATNEFKGLEDRVNSFQKMLVAAFTLNEINSFASDIIDAKTKIDSLKISLDVMLGSKRQSMELMDDVIRLAKSTPFTIDEVAEGVVKLKAYNIATADLIPTMTALGNMAAAVGKEKLPQLTLAYGQVATNGRLMLTELRQFNEAGIPLISLIADAYGKTRDEVQKMADAHQISFDMVRKALLDSSEAGGKYYQLMALQSKTLGGQISNLSDTFFLAKARIGDYLENGIAKGIGLTADFIEVVAGSNSAISRTISTITSATAAWVAGRLALSLYNAQALIAAGRANDMTLSQRILTLTNVEATAAAGASTVTLRGLWAVMAANPIGALLTGVSLLVAAWQGYDAITTQVNDNMDDTGEKLQIEQANVNLLANQVLNLNDGNERRKDLLSLLISRYPDYFAGLDAETTNNATLKGILDKVNVSYERRIELARLAYQTDKANNQLQDLFAQEDKLMSLAQSTLSADVYAKVKGDSAKLLELLKSNKEAADQMWDAAPGEFFKNLVSFKGTGGFTTTLEEVVTGIKEVGTVMQSTNLAMVASTKDRNTTLTEVEEARHKGAVEAAKGNKAELLAEEKRHADNVKSIEEKQAVEIPKIVKAKAESVKTVTLLSAAEIDLILKKGYEDTLKQQIAAIDAQEKVDIEAVNKRVVSKKITSAQLVALEKDAAEKIQAIEVAAQAKRDQAAFDAYKVRSAALGEFVNTELTAISTISAQSSVEVDLWKQNAKDRIDAEKDAIQSRKESAQVFKQATADEHASYKQSLSMLLEIGTQASGIGGMFARGVKMVWENIDLLSGKSLESAQNALSQAQTNLSVFEAIGDKTSAKGIRQLADLQANVSNAGAEVSKVSAMSFESVVGFAGMAYQVLSAIADAYNASVKAQYEAIANGMGRIRESYKNFFDWYKQAAQDSYESDMSSFTGTINEKLAKIREYYREQTEMQKMRDGIDAQLGYYQDMSAAAAAMTDDVKKGIEAIIQAQANQALRQQQQELAAIEVRKRQLKDEFDAKIASLDAILDKAKQTLSDETDAAKDAYDAKKSLIEKERDARRDALNAEMDEIKAWFADELKLNQELFDAETEASNARYEAQREQIQSTYDLSAKLNAQSIADAIEEVAILDRVRNEALARYEVSETQRITATRDRILATLTDEKERALVTAEYERQLLALHEEVEAAKLDKTKGVSLATKQLQKEEKDNAELLKEQETRQLEKLEADHKAELRKSQDEFDAWKETQRAIQAQREQEVKDALVTLQKITDQKLEDAQKELNRKITDLQNQLANTQREILEQKKAAEIGYNDSVRELKRREFDAERQLLIVQMLTETAKMRASRGLFKNNDLENAIIAIEDQVRALQGMANPFATGTEYVDDPNRPDGVDTVPAMLSKGERVLTVEQNRMIGPMSNSELVSRLMLPRVSTPTLMPVRMNLPVASGSAMAGGDVISELQALRQAIETKSLLSLTLDSAGFSTALIDQQSKSTIHANRLQFS
ncbi:tape measure protein [Fibrivirga algicola]|uniref:Tape measure protein n=1 Tax=Fibrivirga algicola TaxID=2950420 RepID=A0ABX0QE57_9BACT|nr:tape measure protein [Fibrivirga algicola]NID09382.1 tape measure protein [Fibrivirga algicola]